MSKIAGNLTLLTRTDFFLIFCSNVSHYSEAQGAPLMNQGKPKWGGTDGCPRCGKPVYFAEEMRALGKKYHKLCLACGMIHCLLWRFTLKFSFTLYDFLAITIISKKKKIPNTCMLNLKVWIFSHLFIYSSSFKGDINIV